MPHQASPVQSRHASNRPKPRDHAPSTILSQSQSMNSLYTCGTTIRICFIHNTRVVVIVNSVCIFVLALAITYHGKRLMRSKNNMYLDYYLLALAETPWALLYTRMSKGVRQGAVMAIGSGAPRSPRCVHARLFVKYWIIVQISALHADTTVFTALQKIFVYSFCSCSHFTWRFAQVARAQALNQKQMCLIFLYLHLTCVQWWR